VTDEPRSRGHLKVFLGYAAGVGKTYQMLSEARVLRDQGIDVVIGYFEPHGRAETIALSEGLETIPRRGEKVLSSDSKSSGRIYDAAVGACIVRLYTAGTRPGRSRPCDKADIVSSPSAA